ncbi:MAG: dihydrofolate reductase [bacterium]
MIISLIAALAENRVIGNKNRIPWHIKDDLLHFKHLTLHHTVIMGRTTFDSLMEYYKKSGKPLPERRHVIVSRDTQYTVTTPGCFVAHSVEEALQLATEKEAEAGGNEGEVFVSGGASIFEQTIHKAQRLHLTLVHGKFEGDTYFPDYSAFTKVIGREEKKTPEGLSYTFLDLEK